jgi:hypothetical protein
MAVDKIKINKKKKKTCTNQQMKALKECHELKTD